MSFLDQLREALEKQVTSIAAKEALILQLAKDNANDECKCVISAMPNKNPCLLELKEACGKVRTTTYHMEQLTKTFAAAVRVTPRCYICGSKGHLKRQCPSKLSLSQPLQSLICRHCHRGGHYAKHCKPQFIVQGQSRGEQYSGNGKANVRGKRVMTQMLPSHTQTPYQAYTINSQPGQVGVPVWMSPQSLTV